MDGELDLLKEAYKPFYQGNRVSLSIIGCIVSLILVPAGFTLDWVIYPELFVSLLWIRIVCGLFIGILLALHFTEVGKQNIRSLMFLWSLAVQCSICFMIYLTDGSSSTYYAGLNLVVLAIGLVLPYSVMEAIAFVIATCILYSLTTYLHTDSAFVFNLYFNNIYFIVLTGIISVVAVFFIEKRRFEAFELSYSLAQKNSELQQLDKLKSQFFANISHELRTPLTLILGPIENLLQSPDRLSTQVESLLQTAKENGLRLLALVNDLLDLTQAEEGKRKLKLNTMDLNIFLAGITHSVTHLAETRNINISFDQRAANIKIDGDQRALEKIFYNLLSNAIKFTESHGQILIISDIQESHAVVTVEDSGIGIDKDQLPFIFDRFRQADGSTTRKYTGTGIGLTLVKEFTEELGGTISVSSEIGKGTTFRITFKLSRIDEDAPRSENSLNPNTNRDLIESLHQEAAKVNIVRIEESDGTYCSTNDKSDLPRLLIVDDEAGMRRYLMDMLSEDYSVITVSDGLAALAKARENPPELMVLDYMLPELDGLSVCRLLKEQPATQSIKIVLLTARVDEDSKIQALESGADDFLTKPFSKVELVTRLRNLLRTNTLELELRENNRSLINTMDELKRVQGKLIQSEKMNALGRLSAGLLHEINNPLNYAHTAIQLLKRESLYLEDEDNKETIDDINDGMLRIKNIIADLRTFAYPSESDHLIEFHINDALDTALRFTASETSRIKTIREIDNQDLVLGSKSHVVQILVNLFSNAALALHSKNDSNEKILKVSSYMKENRHFISVWDNGVGMEQSVIDKIFDPFFTTQEVGQGMGLGLSICHTIVENHGGSLTVDSVLGEWTKFTFDLQAV